MYLISYSTHQTRFKSRTGHVHMHVNLRTCRPAKMSRCKILIKFILNYYYFQVTTIFEKIQIVNQNSKRQNCAKILITARRCRFLVAGIANLWTKPRWQTPRTHENGDNTKYFFKTKLFYSSLRGVRFAKYTVKHSFLMPFQILDPIK